MDSHNYTIDEELNFFSRLKMSYIPKLKFGDNHLWIDKVYKDGYEKRIGHYLLSQMDKDNFFRTFKDPSYSFYLGDDQVFMDGENEIIYIDGLEYIKLTKENVDKIKSYN